VPRADAHRSRDHRSCSACPDSRAPGRARDSPHRSRNLPPRRRRAPTATAPPHLYVPAPWRGGTVRAPGGPEGGGAQPSASRVGTVTDRSWPRGALSSSAGRPTLTPPNRPGTFAGRSKSLFVKSLFVARADDL
jgi:hypothetical protein